MTSLIGSRLRLPDGRQLAWAEYGDPDGRPLLFLHGSPGGKVSGNAARDAQLGRRGLRVIAPERPGYGDSDPHGGRTVAAYSQDLLFLLDELEVERALVVGGSGGGPHALALGAVSPSRTDAVGVLVGAAPLLPEEVALQLPANRQTWAVLSDEDAFRQRLADLRDTIVGPGITALFDGAPASDRALFDRNADAFNDAMRLAMEPGVEGLYDDYLALWVRDWGFALGDVTVPVVWGHGVHDANAPVVAARRVAAQLPDCRFLAWEGAGHAVTAEQLDELLDALLAAAAR